MVPYMVVTAPPVPSSAVAGGGLRFATAAAIAEREDALSHAPVEVAPWRMRERMKTMDVALVLCLNIGTDPPDVAKASPCARKECWVDPFSMPAQKALETIGKTLQSQYERWQARARYRQSLDPTVDEIKQLCVSMRRHAKGDRALFHYNGHGVPRPTPNGEIWVFNKSYTQYIPLLVYDLQAWVGTPAIYVFDCSAAGLLLSHFEPLAAPGSGQGEAIVLAACGPAEVLPLNPELCADVFTSCLTTPITIALRWFLSQNTMSMAHVDASFIERIPGKLTDRKTPLGELNWIFTAITDTIAWNVLPKPLFQKLFRQDLLVASLFRNFLLAERIMKAAGSTPCSLPALPPTHHHPLWRSWDLAAESCLNQLYKLSHPHPHPHAADSLSLQPSRFFAEQLTAFEVWLQFGSPSKPPPQQLPMVLQVLLSQVHRLRALVLLKKFLDLGPWAVNLALSVGIFPYVLKLLQSPAAELRDVLVFIWTKILALDASCQVDLVKDDGHSYFIANLAASLQQHQQHQQQYHHHAQASSSVVPADQKVMSAFVLSVICDQCVQGQRSCLSQYLHKICTNLLVDADEDVRKWVCLCLAKLWENYEDGKRVAIDDQVPRLLSLRLSDDRPEVRAAAACAFGALLGLQVDAALVAKIGGVEHRVDDYIRRRARDDIVIATGLLRACQDASPLVRRETVLALAHVVLHTYHQPRFESVAKHCKNRSLSKRSAPLSSSVSAPVAVDSDANSGRSDSHSHDTRTGASVSSSSERRLSLDLDVDPELVKAIGENAKYYCQVWQELKEIQSRDPSTSVANAAKRIVSVVNAGVLSAEQDALRRASAPASTSTNGSTTSAGQTTTSSSNSHHHHRPESARSAGPSAQLQREGSAPDLPAMAAPLQSRGGHTGGMSMSDRGFVNGGPSHTGLQEPTGLRRSGEPLASTNGDGGSGGIRPTQSVGNFRLYQDEQHRASGSGGPGPTPFQPNAPSMFGNLQHARSFGSDAGLDASTSVRSSAAVPNRHDPIAGRAPAVAAGVGGQSLNVYHPSFQYGRDANFPLALCSKLYERHKAAFNEPIIEPVNEDDDPLSEKGAERMERSRRFDQIRKGALKIAPGFSLPDSSQQLPPPGSYGGAYSSVSPSSYASPADLYAGGSSGYGVAPPRGSEREEVKSFTLNLRQRAVLNCDAEMTSLLLFHPFETLLLVADDKDQISLYNFDQSEKKVMSFGNKNPTGCVVVQAWWAAGLLGVCWIVCGSLLTGVWSILSIYLSVLHLLLLLL